ncbi:hypothetical protein [Thermobacillus xylanilyticus]|uniref:hypothetical protein n=1 Tax=Thermobacillus xylanilyticus TaxID=76633 RepID=UPI001BCE6F2D|nr:hypothetical protein [Thermobacillus xylanilyticus]
MFIRTKNPVELVKVDKGVIPETPNQSMCDFLIYDKHQKVSNFIELKGEDVKKACDQIYGTVEYFENHSVLKQAVTNMELLKGYIVSPHCNVPDIDNTHRKKVYRKLYAKSRSKLANAFDHLVFVRCVPKIVGNATPREENGELKVCNDFPLIL